MVMVVMVVVVVVVDDVVVLVPVVVVVCKKRRRQLEARWRFETQTESVVQAAFRAWVSHKRTHR